MWCSMTAAGLNESLAASGRSGRHGHPTGRARSSSRAPQRAVTPLRAVRHRHTGSQPRRIPRLWFEWFPNTHWAWAPDDRQIYVLLDTWDTNRGLELTVIGRGGGRLRQLTPQDLGVGAFDVSSDGRKIALQAASGGRDWEIYVMASDGRGMTQLTDNRQQGRAPRWSPDGQRILFTSERDGNSEVYVMNADRSDQTNLSRNPGREDHPSWIP
jgi:dipeptidyl aminopeptidase/acylaminoacyl peptidase